MVTLSEEQRNIIGWVLTIGFSLGISGLSVLVMYCLYCCYKVIKKFSDRN